MIQDEKKSVNYFEKIVFLEMTNKQLCKFQNSEYYETYNNLKKEEQELIDNKIANEIHEIWANINAPNFKERPKSKIESIKEYHDSIHPVSSIILKVASDYNITLKRELSDDFINAIRDVFGQDYLDNFLDNDL